MTRRPDKRFERPGLVERSVGIGVVVGDDIEPNAWGKFKKATGEKGTESATGAELDGYFRTDPGDIPLKDGDMVVWLDLPNGYDLNPLFCNRE